MGEYWFKPRHYGYGVTPVTWQGWGVMLLSAAITVLCILNLTFGAQTFWNWSATVLLLVLVTLALVYISRLKTDGEWKWRWGDRK